MNYIKKNKRVLVLLATLAWPTVLEEFLSTIIQYIDTAMVGRIGKEATATVSLSSTYSWLINSVIYAIGIGFLSYVARAVGEKNEYKIQKAAGQAVSAALSIGAVLTLVTLIIAPYMPIWMGADPSIRRNGSIYFAIINAPLIFRSAIIIFGSVIRATGDTKTPMLVNVFVNLINTGLNFVFIYMLGLGAIGAGIATAIAYVIGGIIMTYAYVHNKTLKFNRENLKLEKNVMWGCLSVGIPVMFTQIASCSGYVVATSFVSSMAIAVYSAHSIAITAETIFYIPGYGMQAATSTLIGNSIGENDEKKAKSVMGISVIVIFSLMCITGLLLFISAKGMMSIFTKDSQVIEIGARLLRIVAFTEPIFGTAAVMEGIYDGMGRTKFPFVATLCSRWGVRILGSYICIRKLGLGINQIWYCMIGDNILRAIMLAIGIIIIIKKHKISSK